MTENQSESLRFSLATNDYWATDEARSKLEVLLSSLRAAASILKEARSPILSPEDRDELWTIIGNINAMADLYADALSKLRKERGH